MPRIAAVVFTAALAISPAHAQHAAPLDRGNGHAQSTSATDPSILPQLLIETFSPQQGLQENWDRILVWAEVPGSTRYILELTEPPKPSCILPGGEETFGRDGGTSDVPILPGGPGTSIDFFYQCADGRCRIRAPVLYDANGRGPDGRCIKVVHSYQWAVRADDGHRSTRVRFSLPAR
jgi:hypothetical protein